MKDIIWMAILLGALSACGSSDDNKAADAFEATGGVYKLGSAGTAEVTLEDAEEGAQYLVMPYALGATTGSNQVTGGSSEAFNFDIYVEGASLALGHSGAHLSASESEQVMSGRDFDHALRSLINRFDFNNPEDYEKLKKLEDTIVKDGPYSRLYLKKERRGLSNLFKKVGEQVSKNKAQAKGLQLADNGCPDVTNVKTFAATAGDANAMKAEEVSIDATDTSYCIYVHKASGYSTETDIERIKTSVTNTLKAYKEVIYDDNFTKVKDGYSFQPLIVVLPFNDSYYWPGTDALKISAAFSSALSLANGRPSLYVAADQAAVSSSGESDQTVLNQLFHSAIAHEMSHAILHYYRYNAGIEIDSVQFDEGLAHLMEDVLGYGEVNFDSYPSNFLLVFPYGTEPFLKDISKEGTSGTAAQRGAAHTLFYYLISQAGGVSFDGAVSGGDGLNFVRKYATGTARNIEGLSSAYGSDWIEAMGNYLGALAIDNATTVIEKDEWKVQSPEEDVEDTVGNEEKQYGMRFHGYGGLPDLKDTLANFTTTESDQATFQGSYYQTTPILVTLTASQSKLQVESDDEGSNSGVTVVRIK